MPEALIEVHGLDKHYGRGRARQEVLRGVELSVARGELLALVGESGSGKTTLLNVLGGLDREYEGTAKLAGEDLARLSDRALSALRNRTIGFVFQHFNLLEHLSALENVALPSLFAAGPSRQPALLRAREALEQVGLGDRAADLARTLSGGQKQRVALARALFNEPPLLLCDEPTGNLDSETGQQIIELFGRLNRETGSTFVIVTHEARVSQAARRVVRMVDGRIVDDTAAPTSEGAGEG